MKTTLEIAVDGLKKIESLYCSEPVPLHGEGFDLAERMWRAAHNALFFVRKIEDAKKL